MKDHLRCSRFFLKILSHSGRCDILFHFYLYRNNYTNKGDLEELQTQEINVTRGEAEGDIDHEGLPFLKVTQGPRHYYRRLRRL